MMSSRAKTKSQEGEKSDSRVQFSLRLPADLHARLLERAGLVPLNSFIVQSLEASLKADEVLKLAATIEDTNKKLTVDAARALEHLANRVDQLNAESISTLIVLQAFLDETRKELPQDTYESIQRATREVLEDRPLTALARRAVDRKL